MLGAIAAHYVAATAGVVVADDFNRADSSSLGSTSVGSAPWSVLTGAWGISSNTASPGATTLSLAVVQTGVADCTVQMTVNRADTATPPFFGLCFRAVDVNNNWVLESGASSGTAKLYKKVAGGAYSVAAQSASPIKFLTNDIVQVVLSGTSITVKRNGATIITVTDSALSTATRHGLYASGSPSLPTRIDDFSVT